MATADDGRATPADPRVYFAAERTLLAWVRTGLAMMGFGFVVTKFGLFLREIAHVQGLPPPRQFGPSLWLGVVLAAVGVMATLFAAVSYALTVRRLERGLPLRFRLWSLATTVAVLIALLGLAMTVYLLAGLIGAD